jgi:hypothetical protein
MGIAPIWMDGRLTGSSWTEQRGNVEIITGTAAMACHSLPDAERGTAGVTGALLPDGRAQQAGVAHLAGW